MVPAKLNQTRLLTSDHSEVNEGDLYAHCSAYMKPESVYNLTGLCMEDLLLGIILVLYMRPTSLNRY